MIPGYDSEYVDDTAIEIIKGPTHTHKMHIAEERVKGFVDDDIEAVKQMIYKCINTEKDLFPIYPNFGVMKRDLFGKKKQYAYIVLTRRIEDALMLDDRIEDVYDFVYMDEWSKEDNLGMKFKVKTIFENSPIPIEEVISLAKY